MFTFVSTQGDAKLRIRSVVDRPLPDLRRDIRISMCIETIREPIEIGWHLGRAYWGQGYATESSLGALRHGFETLGLAEIYAIVHHANTRSLRVCGRLGMTLVGTTDRYHDMELKLYRILSGEHSLASPTTSSA